MSKSSNPARPLDFDFELPIEPGFDSLPPKGTWEDGYKLSLMGLEMIKDRLDIQKISCGIIRAAYNDRLCF